MDTTEITRYAHKDLWIRMYFVALFSIKKRAKISKSSNNEGLLKKLWYTCILDNYLLKEFNIIIK